MNQHGTRMLASNLEITVKVSNNYIPVGKKLENRNQKVYVRNSGQYTMTRNSNTNTYTNMHSDNEAIEQIKREVSK